LSFSICCRIFSDWLDSHRKTRQRCTCWNDCWKECLSAVTHFQGTTDSMQSKCVSGH